MSDQNTEIVGALDTIDRLLVVIKKAERQLKSARNWSFWDLFGGGTIIGLIKHYKLNKAGNLMSDANYLLGQLNTQLGNIQIPETYHFKMNGFAAVADFVFDGVLVDAYMVSKIMKSIKLIKNLRKKLKTIKSNLESMN